MYLHGGVEEIEIYTADYSQSFPCEALPIIAAVPADACETLLNSDDCSGKIVIVERGKCSFGMKSKHVAEAGGKLTIVINSDNRLFTISSGLSGDASGLEKSIATVLVRKRAGLLLTTYITAYLDLSIERQQESSSTELLMGLVVGEYMDLQAELEERIMPCGTCYHSGSQSDNRSTESWRTYERFSSALTGGHFKLSSVSYNAEKNRDDKIVERSFEFFSSSTGIPLPTLTPIWLSKSSDKGLKLLLLSPLDGCTPLIVPSDQPAHLTNPFGVLIDRGDCTFLVKLEHAYDIGASFVVFVNDLDNSMTVPSIGPAHGMPTTETVLGDRSGHHPKPGFSKGSLLPSMMIRTSAGALLRQRATEQSEESLNTMLTIEPTELSIDDYDHIAELYEVSSWNPDRVLRKQQYQGLVSSLTNQGGEQFEADDKQTCHLLLVQEKVAEVNRLYQLANDFYQ